jgi:YgiT-type zinc finger domain-containing protein
MEAMPMAKSREKLEQELVEQAQKAIRELLDQLPNDNQVTLSDLEQARGEMGATMMRQTLQSLSEGVETKPSGSIGCPNCGQPMYRRGKRVRKVVTMRGEIEVERDYYPCPNCGQGYFPPG